jgi:hypothetical protein
MGGAGGVDSHQRRNQSYSSTPAAKLVVDAAFRASSVVSSKSDRSDQRCPSLRSESPLFGLLEHPDLEASSTALTDFAVIAEQNIQAVGSDDFERNWKISERRAAEDGGSTVDVFHVDFDQNQSHRSNCPSTVSQWMKSIRVVCDGGSVGSNTSEMSKSSAEHSSVEPKSMQQDVIEGSSVDFSLERSLANSAVDCSSDYDIVIYS